MKTQLTTLHNASRPFAMKVSARKPVLPLLMRLFWTGVLVLPAFGAQAAVVLTTLHSFEVFPNGANPSGLVQTSDGYFYGTTYWGGTKGNGPVFRLSTNGG